MAQEVIFVKPLVCGIEAVFRSYKAASNNVTTVIQAQGKRDKWKEQLAITVEPQV